MPNCVDPLAWPFELPSVAAPTLARWQHPPSNRLMDIHGDPSRADLVVFSDGNHHMALAEAIQAFDFAHRLDGRILYLTLPPQILLDALHSGGLQVGNLTLALSPHVMIGPAQVLDQVVDAGRMREHRGFMQSVGNVLMVARGNPLNIQGIADLYRPDVRLFISNPVQEKASFGVYRDALQAIADLHGLDGAGLAADLAQGGGRIVHGERVHHREAPVAVACGEADAAVLYFHLALRYTGVFADRFELIPLPGSPTHTQPHLAANGRTTYHVGCVDEGGIWGTRFKAFLQSRQVADIYSTHGLAPL